MSSHDDDDLVSGANAGLAISETRTSTSVEPTAIRVSEPMHVRGAVASSWESDSEQPSLAISLLSYLEIPFVHAKLIVGCLLTAMLLSWLAILVWPRTYESESKLLIRIGHESVGLDPTATTSQTLVMEKTQEEEVNSALEVLNSRRLAERVVETLGERPILDGVLPAGEGSTSVEQSAIARGIAAVVGTAKGALFNILLATGIKEDFSDREMAIREIMDTVGIYAPKKSTVISIHATSRTPEMAQAIAQTLAEQYLEHHLDASHTTGSQKFFQTQADLTQQQLQTLLDQRSDFMQRNRIVSISANLGILTDQLSAIERDMLDAKSQLDQATAEMNDLQDKITATEEEIVAAKEEVFDETWSGMRQTVYELELQERSLASRYTDDYLPLKQVRLQLEGAQEILEKMQSERVNLSTVPNPVKIQLKTDLQQLETRVAGLRSMLQKKQSQQNEVIERVNELHRLEQKLAQMDRDVKVRESSLLILSDKLEEARIIDELLSERISSVNVVQPGTFVERPASPNKKLVVAGLTLLGLIGGIGLAFLREMNSTVLRSETHVTSHLQTQVLATLPDVPALRQAKEIRIDQLGEIRICCSDILSQVLLANPGQRGSNRGRSLGIVSLDTGSGASSLAAALALTSAEDCGLRTTLIDADTQQRTLSTAFGLNGSPGLVELAAGDATHHDCVQHKPGSPLALISSSSSYSKRRLDAEPRSIRAAIDRFQDESDLVIVDLPSASRPDLAIPLAQHLDCLIVVVESEKTAHSRAGRLMRQFRNGETQVLGTVLSKHRSYIPRTLRKILVPQST